MKTIVLIPAYNPDNELLVLVRELSRCGIKDIFVVDDGSHKQSSNVFNKIENHKVKLIHHNTNMGKGAALKTGFKHIYNNYSHCFGVVTADADGQHCAEDIFKIYTKLKTQTDSLILGVRQFNAGVPLRNRFGNALTRWIMYVCFGIKLSDTQTGLRGIPMSALPLLINIPYNRYEFETEMLLTMIKSRYGIYELPIQTIYSNKNYASHFNPIIDSFKIYALIFRHIISIRTEGKG